MIVHAFEGPAPAALLADVAAVLGGNFRAVDEARAARLATVAPVVHVDRSQTPARAGLAPALAEERGLLAARVALAAAALACVPAVRDPRGGPVAGRAADAGLAAALVAADRLFAVGLFFEVHEVLEPVWQRLGGARRRSLQGLIQLAVGLHHLVHGRPGSAATLLAAGREKLAAAPPPDARIDVARLLAAVAPWEARARAGEGWSETLELPRLLVPAG